MSRNVYFILGIHNHLPNGTPEEEFEALYNSKIRPLVSALYQYPRINVVFHYSGVLLHWIERRHPELFVLIEDLLSRKQVELLGGGFYEPMMTLLPLVDRIGQIEMLTTYLRRQFGKRPQGLRLPLHAWEQNLVGSLCACGMNYTFLNESDFSAAKAVCKAGFFYEPCITEDQGKIITVFPVYASLAGIKPTALLEKLKDLTNSKIPCEGPLTVFPAFANNTYEKAEAEYQHFFEELSGADSNIEFTTPGRIYRNFNSLKKLYFTANGADKDSDNPYPRQFMTEYPEAESLYIKMIHTRVLINHLRGDKSRKQTALEESWKAQDSVLFSPAGLGNVPVRKAAYRALLEAEKITRRNGSFTSSISIFDYDLDGEDEFVLSDDKLNCYIKARGAFLFELDYLPKTWNFLDTFIPDSTLKKIRRGAFSEYLFPGTNPPEAYWHSIPGARFYGNEIFENIKLDRVQKQVQFIFPANNAILPGKPAQKVVLGSIEVKKTWHLKRNAVNLQYMLKNTGPDTERFFLIPSVDFSFSGGDESFVRFLGLYANSKEAINPGIDAQIHKDLLGLEFRDLKNETVLSLESGKSFTAKIFRVAFNSEYQFNTIMPMFNIVLDPGKSWDTGFTLKISS